MIRILTIIAILTASPVWAEYERPSYNVVLKEDGLEIRDYAPAIVVETQVLASRRDAAGLPRDGWRMPRRRLTLRRRHRLGRVDHRVPRAPPAVSPCVACGCGSAALRRRHI